MTCKKKKHYNTLALVFMLICAITHILTHQCVVMEHLECPAPVVVEFHEDCLLLGEEIKGADLTTIERIIK